jgi:hypothetical protein
VPFPFLHASNARAETGSARALLLPLSAVQAGAAR